MNAFWHLENIDVTHLLCPTKLGDEHRMSKTHQFFKKGDPVYVPAEMADRIFFISDGKVKISSMNDEGKEITNLTANSRQTVTTTLNDLRTQKLLTFNRSRLLVRDMDKLAAEIRH